MAGHVLYMHFFKVFFGWFLNFFRLITRFFLLKYFRGFLGLFMIYDIFLFVRLFGNKGRDKIWQHRKRRGEVELTLGALLLYTYKAEVPLSTIQHVSMIPFCFCLFYFFTFPIYVMNYVVYVCFNFFW